MNPQEKNTYVRQQITKALISLMKRKKITDISISEICDKAQVGRASFYRNYDSKEEVIEKHTEFMIRSWAETIEMDPNANIYNFFTSMFGHFQKNSDFYKILYKQNMSPMILGAIRKKLNVVPGMDADSLYASAYIAYGVFGWIDIWFSNGMKETPEELNRIIVSNISARIKGAKAAEEL